jgi:hypothetical protein
MLTSVLVTAVLVLHLFALPGWIPGVSASASGSSRSTGAPALPDLSIVAGDGELTVSLPPGTDPGQYRVDAVSETNAADPGSCLVAAGGSPSGPGCSVHGLRNGLSYLVTLGRADDPAGAPVRMKHATPLPRVLLGSGIVAWYDAADYTSVRPDQHGPARVGSRVAFLRDKSSRHADATQPDQGAMPVMGQLGANPALKLSSTNYLVADERGLPQGGHAATVIAVAALDDPVPADSCFRTVLAWGVGQPNQARLLEKGCHNDLAYAETFGSWPVQQPTTSWPTGRATVVSAQFDRKGTSIWVNHRLSNTWVSPPNMTPNTVAGEGLILGAVTWSSQDGWVGRIGEVVIFDRALTPAERQATELYLAAKWQVQLAPDSLSSTP